MRREKTATPIFKINLKELKELVPWIMPPYKIIDKLRQDPGHSVVFTEEDEFSLYRVHKFGAILSNTQLIINFKSLYVYYEYRGNLSKLSKPPNSIKFIKSL